MPAYAKPTPPPARCASTADSLDALVPAFVIALLVGIDDRAAWFAAILSSRGPARVVAIYLTIIAAGLTLAAVCGGWIGPLLSPAARDMLLGMALLAAAATAFWPTARPALAERWPPLVVATMGAGGVVISDAAGLTVLALAARSPMPLLAAAGSFAGALTLSVAAAALGERGWEALPRRRLGLVSGSLLLVGGVWYVGGGLRLI